MKYDRDDLTGRIIGCAIEVHRELGPGFLEAIYEEALAFALNDGGFAISRQPIIPVRFRDHVVGQHRLDLVVDGAVVVELKAVAAFEDVHYAVVRSYLRATGLADGLLMNFASPTLQVRRIGAEFKGRE